MDFNDIKVRDLKKGESGFEADPEYLKNMPDMQNKEFHGTYIDLCGLTNFRVPIRIAQRDGGTQEVLASIHGFCDVQSHKAGLNMSRIVRTFYKSKDDVFNIDKLKEILLKYKEDQESFNTNIQLEFDYYVPQDSLVSRNDEGKPLQGYYIVHCVLDVHLDWNGKFRKLLKVFWQFSSACPCSTALSEYIAVSRGLGAIPHSQRSTVAVTVEFDDMVWIEDIIDHCRKALVTECQSIVKREDEAEFAMLNYAHQKFIEDATRLLAAELNTDQRIKDFKILDCHAESLHQHSVVGLITKGVIGSIFNNYISTAELKELEQMC